MCKRGRFNLDNEIRDLTATLLTEVEVCHDISVEPGLQPISNEILTGATANTQDGVRLDIAANGFSECSIPMLRQTGCYRKHEQTKKCMYEQRCREVEHASFTPLVISAMGGLAKEATIFYKRLASMRASKWDTPYSSTLCWLQCRLAFSLLRSAIQSIIVLATTERL